MQIRENARGFYINVTHGTSQRPLPNNRHPLTAAAAIEGSTSFSCFPLSFRACPGIQAAKESILTWTPARRPEWQIKKQAGVTDKKTGRNDRREKMLRYDRRKKTLYCDGKRKNAVLWQERINSQIPWRFLTKTRNDSMGGQLLRNRGMTEREGNTGRRWRGAGIWRLAIFG